MLKVFSMFAGYGTDNFALKKLGIDYQCVGFSEIDKYAIQCFKQNHGNIKNFGDCRTINPQEIPDFDLLTAGFPCQAFSTAGKQLGEQDDRGTLFYDIIRIAEVKKPKYLLLENVKNLTSKKFKETFNRIILELHRIGYGVCWKVLDSRDFGIPQSRERIWFVCKFGGWKFGEFQFPHKRELKIFIQDILEKDIPEKYYLTKEQHEKFKDFDNQIHSLYPRSDLSGNGGHGHLSKSDGISYCIDTGNMQFIDVYNRKFQDFSPALSNPNHNTLGCFAYGRYRKLTPKECFKLMGFLNNEIDLDGLSDTQKYKLAGNGQDVNVVSLILKEMLK